MNDKYSILLVKYKGLYTEKLKYQSLCNTAKSLQVYVFKNTKKKKKRKQKWIANGRLEVTNVVNI